MRISDWSSDVCSSDLAAAGRRPPQGAIPGLAVGVRAGRAVRGPAADPLRRRAGSRRNAARAQRTPARRAPGLGRKHLPRRPAGAAADVAARREAGARFDPPPRRLERTPCVETRSEEQTSELQSLMRISYAVFCLKTKK